VSEATSTMIFVAAEFGGIILLLFIIAIFLFVKRRASDKRYVANFIAEHKQTHAERRESMREKMLAGTPVNDEVMDEVLDDVSASEKRLYKRVLNMYLGFDRQCITDIRDEMSEMNHKWIDTLNKSLNQLPEGTVSEEEVQELNNTISELTAENTKISSDLAEAMETMEDIVKEYSLMYAGQENETMDKLSDNYQKLKDKAESHK